MTIRIINQATDKMMTAFDTAGFEIRFVGGCVRDLILGIVPKDIDLCTDANPDEMKDIATANDFGFIPTGLDHGTVTMVVDGEHFEVTTLRIDRETDGRHAIVEFTRSFEEDAKRRDLTINAMSMDKAGKVYDYFGGVQDLKDRTVRFVGNAEERIKEDYLRILRYFRFAARFDAAMDEDTLNIIARKDILDGLFKVSVERWEAEMMKILDPSMPARSRIVDLMFKTDVLHSMWLFRYNPTEIAMSDDAETALATLVSEIQFFETNWKVSRETLDFVKKMVDSRSIEFDAEMAEDKIVMDGWDKRDMSRILSVRPNMEAVKWHIENFTIPVMPVQGRDLIERGISPGPEMGRMLKDMKEAWRVSRFTMTRDEMMVGI